MGIQTYKPSPTLDPYIESYMVIEPSEKPYFADPLRLIPTGQALLFINLGDKLRIWDGEDIDENIQGVWMYGPVKHICYAQCQGKNDMVIIKFKHNGLFPFLKENMEELASKIIILESVAYNFAKLIEDKINETPHTADRIIALEKVLNQRLTETKVNLTTAAKNKQALLNNTLNAIIDSGGKHSVIELCSNQNTYYKQLERLFLKQIGLTPKRVAKLARVKTALDLVHQSKHEDWFMFARDIGYYDQSHFIKDFKNNTGLTPKQYVDRVKNYNPDLCSIK